MPHASFSCHEIMYFQSISIHLAVSIQHDCSVGWDYGVDQGSCIVAADWHHRQSYTSPGAEVLAAGFGAVIEVAAGMGIASAGGQRGPALTA